MIDIHLRRRIQIICALFLHVPLVAILAYAIATGFMAQLSILLVALVATLAATLTLVPFLGRALDGPALPERG